MSDLIKREDAIKYFAEFLSLNRFADFKNVNIEKLVGKLCERIPTAEPKTGDLISREDAIKAVSEPFDRKYWQYTTRSIRDTVKALKDIPSAEPKQGEWIPFIRREEGERVMTEIKLTKRYPQSRTEDIVDAYMRGWNDALDAVQNGKFIINDDRKTESDSEKPNNCETCKHNHKEWWELPCDWCCGTHGGYEPKTEPQTEDPPMDEYYKDHDEFYDCDRYVVTNDEGERAYNCIGCEQTDCAWGKGE